MPKNTESLNRTLFELLHSKGLDPTMLSTAGKEIPTPEEAEVFQFNFVKDGEDYGTVTLSIDGLHKLVVYFSDDVANSEKEESEAGDVSWYQLLNQLKKFSQKYQLSFELRNVNNLKHDMAKREYMKKKESIAEGYYPMGRKASYSDAVPSVKIVLQHTRQIEEGEQRYRNVERIFLENEQGERFLAPTTRPGIARVYARHIAEGGKPHDERWNHIGSLCEEYSKMAGFVRATRNGQFTESTQKLIAEGINHYQSLRESLGKLAGHRGYNAYFESWSPPLMEDDSDMSNINELFVQETVDPRIESVMPILSKLQKKISEMSEVNELSEWADKLIEGDEDIEDDEADDATDDAEEELTEDESLTSNNPQGVPESAEDNPVAGAITRRILSQRLDLLKKYGPVAITQAIDDVADFVGDVDEIGSSDVSGWIKQIERSLGGVDEGMIDTVKKIGSKVFDKLGGGSDEDLLKDLQKKAGIPAHAQHGKPNMGHSKDEKRLEELDKGTVSNYVNKAVDDLSDRSHDTGVQKGARVASQAFAGGSKESGRFEKDPKIANRKVGISRAISRLEEEGEFAGNYATGEAGQWRNKGPKANKPATIGDLVGEAKDEESHQAKTTMKHVDASDANDKTKAAIRKASADIESGIKGYGSRAAALKAAGIEDDRGPRGVTMAEGQDDLDTIKRLLGEGAIGGMLGGMAGSELGGALGNSVAGTPGKIAGTIGGAIGGSMLGNKLSGGDEEVKEEQLNEVIGPMIANGARALLPMLSKIGPALGRMASSAKAVIVPAAEKGAQVAGQAAKTAMTGAGQAAKVGADAVATGAKGAIQGAGQAAKAGAEVVAKNAIPIATGAGIYSAITDLANGLMGGVGQVYNDVGDAAKAITEKIGNSVDNNTLGQLAQAAVKYAIPIGILLAVLYGGKKILDKVLSESAGEGQDDLDTIRRLVRR